MLIGIDSSNKLLWWNDILSRVESEPYIENGAVWLDSVAFPDPPQVEGKTAEYYLNPDGTIRYEYVDNPADESIIEPSNTEISENQTIMMMALADIYEQIGGNGNA